MDRWVPWPSLDLKVLLSFPLQWMYATTSICQQYGLHWTQLFGIMRVLTVTRVLHFMQCAENNAMLEQKLDTDRQIQLKIAKLLLRLAFITHFSACMWCAVARVELGFEATEFTPSAFFPHGDVLFSQTTSVFNAYSRAVHWAFVNLSGIGDVDSTPETTLECWSTIVVHMIGAGRLGRVFCSRLSSLVGSFASISRRQSFTLLGDILPIKSNPGFALGRRVSEGDHPVGKRMFGCLRGGKLDASD